jgi:hypothetical protein
MITSENYTQKVKRLEWLKEMADEHGISIYEEEIFQLESVINKYDDENAIFIPLGQVSLINFHLSRTNISKPEMAKFIGLSYDHLQAILTGRKPISARVKHLIDKCDFGRLKELI